MIFQLTHLNFGPQYLMDKESQSSIHKKVDANKYAHKKIITYPFLKGYA